MWELWLTIITLARANVPGHGGTVPALWKDQPIFYSVTLRSCLRKPLDRSPRQPSPMTTHSVGSSTKPFTWCIVELDGVWLPLLLDTAASRSLLNVSTVRWLFPRQVIRADAEEKNGYRHAKIGMVGTTIFSARSAPRLTQHSSFRCQAKAATSWSSTCSVPSVSPSRIAWHTLAATLAVTLHWTGLPYCFQPQTAHQT